jgi:hypothetical protein
MMAAPWWMLSNLLGGQEMSTKLERTAIKGITTTVLELEISLLDAELSR